MENMAEAAATFIGLWCSKNFGDGQKMASKMAGGTFMEVFKHKGYASHKYIPAEKLSTDLELEPGSGVYGYWEMEDGSCLLCTCSGPLAHWSGKKDEPACWVKINDDDN